MPVSFGDDEKTERVIQGVQADGTCWCGGTTWRGRRAMRIGVSSFTTTDQDVNESLAAMARIAYRHFVRTGLMAFRQLPD